MKIALLVKRFTRSGGKERYAVELARVLKDLGHDIHVYAYKCDISLSDEVTFHKVPLRYRFSSIANTFSFIRETKRVVQKKDYDIIHSHERNYTQPIVTLHSFSYLEGLEKYSFFRKIDQKYLSLRSLLYLVLERRQMKSPWLISVSRQISEDVKKHYCRAEKIETIPPGVDTDNFSPGIMEKLRVSARKENCLNKDELAILFVGSAFQRKGLDRILPEIKDNMKLFVVGKGDRSGRFKKLIKRYGIEKKVVLAGMVKNIKKYYALADVMVLPSHSEAFGMSILEAMSCGVAVVVSKNCGVADLIQHKKNGLVMKYDSDLNSFLKHLSSKENRLKIGKYARKTAESYTWERVGKAHEKFYQKTLS